MGIFHFLNVRNGDCSVIQHPSGHVTVVDVYNASSEEERALTAEATAADAVRGNFNQKAYPVNPIEYLEQFDIDAVFRFILTHPDMDHMGGIREFFQALSPTNFWDTANTCEKDDFGKGGPHDEEDWLFYKNLRDEDPNTDPKRLVLNAGASGKYFNKGEDGNGGGDGLHVLAPTKTLIQAGNEADDFNDSSYVILYRSNAGRILLAGDSHDKTWEHILKNHADDVRDVDLLLAPHHGRKSDRSYEFLDVVNPALTFFGNANSEHLAYGAWNSRGLPFITNNQANCIVVDTNGTSMSVYVTNEAFARMRNPSTYYVAARKAYYLRTITR